MACHDADLRLSSIGLEPGPPGWQTRRIVLEIAVTTRGHGMPAAVTREEFEARVGVLEQEVEGEKLVTRHILELSNRPGATVTTSRPSRRASIALRDASIALRERSMAWIKDRSA